MRLLALTAAAVLLLAGCSSGDEPTSAPTPSASASPIPAPTADPPPPVPSEAACYRISYDDALAPANADAVVPCTKKHTSQTFSVGTLDTVVDGHLLAVDSDRVSAQVAEQCPQRLAGWLGATPEQLRLTLLRPVWFTPSLEESDAGAGWFRCDVIAVTGDDKVAKVQGDLQGALKKPTARDTYGMCGTARPGEADFSHVLCRDPHTWRAITVVDLADAANANGGYPGEKKVRAAGEDGVCADAAREVAADALDYEWGYEWPTKEQWRGGQTYGRCWAPS